MAHKRIFYPSLSIKPDQLSPSYKFFWIYHCSGRRETHSFPFSGHLPVAFYPASLIKITQTRFQWNDIARSIGYFSDLDKFGNNVCLNVGFRGYKRSHLFV